MVKRLLVVIILIPVGIGLIALGGPVYAVFIAAILGIAGWEFDRMARVDGFQPSRVLLIGGTATFALARAFLSAENSLAVLAALVMIAMMRHLVAYEHGREKAATDFSITLGGLLYLGLLGSYLVMLRNLEDGKWLILIVLPAIWIADSAAMMIGSRWGRHAMAPRLSPHKTWEGYFAGVLGGALGGWALTALWGLAAPTLIPWKGALLGFVLGAVTPFGDLGESMIKRQAGMKDSSHIIPGHGGVMDRIDSWLWAAVIGFYWILWLW